ncbi:MAG: succinate dehydrogenase cytochrome b subunit [Candidatus Handelsmanbacteria bacterium]|nr:succinate dehydrogenase cytochrome b subunit [Candidatus Handelsmanbacteria bacterium]
MLAKLFTGSVGKKFGMALTGLALYVFLAGHLAGNLLLLKKDGGAQFNAYSEYLLRHPLLVPVEIGLVAVFLLHVWLAISVSRDNRRARPHGYQIVRASGGRNLASRTMLYSGLLIFVFLIVHIVNFKYGDRGGGTLYDLVVGSFKTPLYAGGYVLAMTLLGFHLWHSFQSAFQTLGIALSPRLRSASILVCLVLAGGFGVIPLWIFFFFR